eukprot:m.78223 g.78223  ORF g.78223 m.78223 type:complete len:1153 (+) comp12527_c0_seq2:27-3485(+)
MEDIMCELASTQLLRKATLATRKDALPFVPVYLVVGMLGASMLETISWQLFALMMAAVALIQAVVALSATWSVHAAVLIRYHKVSTVKGATHVLFVSNDRHLKHQIAEVNLVGDTILAHFQLLPYEFNESTGTWKPLSYPSNEPLDYYIKNSGVTSDRAQAMKQTYGKNSVKVPVPSFQTLYISQLTAPLFVFQVFCMVLYLLDDYWYFSLLTLGLLLFIESTTATQRLANLRELYSMHVPSRPVQVCRSGKWSSIKTSALVPGDIIALDRSKKSNKVPADLLVLGGSCVVNEALLTGEAVPLKKEAFPRSTKGATLQSLPGVKHFTLFAGTEVVQTTTPSGAGLNEPKGCRCMVLRTGFATQQGSLVRSFLAATEQASANNKESLQFILFLLIFAVAAAGYVFYHGLIQGRLMHKLIIECLLILTAVIPPELPLQLSLAITNALKAMNQRGVDIACIEPFRIPMAGRADVVCFDKTGTLTSSTVSFEGLYCEPQTLASEQAGEVSTEGVASASASDSIQAKQSQLVVGYVRLKPTDIGTMSWTMDAALAACHSLVQVNGQLVGDPLEVSILKRLGWSVSETGVVTSSDGKRGIKKVSVNPFNSTLKRMSVIADVQINGKRSRFVFCKGAPEIIAEQLAEKPESFDRAHTVLSSRGKRILALAMKEIPGGSKQSRDMAEADLKFLGFIVMGSKLKADATKTLSQLTASSHLAVMITGDSPLTASFVASVTGITTKPTAILDSTGGDGWQLRVPEPAQGSSAAAFEEAVPAPASIETLKQTSTEYDVCVTGGVIDDLESQGKLAEGVPFIKVYARTTPNNKSSIVCAYGTNGMTTIMCGDGTNDVGALKSAHAGIALLEHTHPSSKASSSSSSKSRSKKVKKQSAYAQAAQQMAQEDVFIPKFGDASMAAPFTARSKGCSSVVHLVRQGRATLVTANQMQQILALNCLINAFSLSVLYLDGIKLSDTQMTINGFGIAIGMFLLSRSKPLKQLSQQRPRSSVLSPYMFSSVLLQLSLHVAIMLNVLMKVKALVTLPPFDPDAEYEFEPNLTNSVVYLLLIVMQITTIVVSYRGYPFMEGITDSIPLMALMGGLVAAAFAGAFEQSPGITEMLELAPIPETLQSVLGISMLADIVGCFVIDRLCSLIFPAPSLSI